jgi:hypothetical protein
MFGSFGGGSWGGYGGGYGPAFRDGMHDSSAASGGYQNPMWGPGGYAQTHFPNGTPRQWKPGMGIGDLVGGPIGGGGGGGNNPPPPPTGGGGGGNPPPPPPPAPWAFPPLMMRDYMTRQF